MIKSFRNASMFALALAAAILINVSRPAEAQQAAIEFKIFKVGLIVGVGGGSGTLVYQGRSYPIKVGGVSLGASIGISSADMVGEVYNLTNVSDIAGSYSGTKAGLAIAGGGKVASLKNARGVVIKARGKQIGLAVNLDLTGMTISLK